MASNSNSSLAPLSTNIRTSCHKKFWTEFFFLYKNLPALWNKNSAAYRDRIAKRKACDQLAVKLSELKPGSTHKDVVRQINIFRTNYRRERARTIEFQTRYKNYRPALWYYKFLAFLDTHEFPNQIKLNAYNGAKDIIEETKNEMEQYIIYENIDSSPYENRRNSSTDTIKKSNYDEIADKAEGIIYGYLEENENEIENENENGNENIPLEEDLEIPDKNAQHQHFENDKIYNEEAISNSESTDNLYYPEVVKNETTNGYMIIDDVVNSNQVDDIESNFSTEVATSTENLIKFKRDIHTMTDETLFSRTRTRTISKSEILAQSWGIQYDEMSAEQKVFARKAIADILFAGCLGKLTIRQGKWSIDIDDII